MSGRGSPLGPMALWAHEEEAGRRNGGLVEIPQRMAVQEGPFRSKGRRASPRRSDERMGQRTRGAGEVMGPAPAESRACWAVAVETQGPGLHLAQGVSIPH